MEQRFIRVPRTARYHVLGDAKKAKRIWIVLHGYGQLARYFLNKFEGIGTDLLIVAPEGLSRFYTDVSHQRVGATWMTREDRDHEIVDQIEYLDTLVAEIQKEALPDATWGVLGFSQGVATAYRWLMQGNTKVDKVVLWGGPVTAGYGPYTDHGKIRWNAGPACSRNKRYPCSSPSSGLGAPNLEGRWCAGHVGEV